MYCIKKHALLINYFTMHSQSEIQKHSGYGPPQTKHDS